MSRLMKVLKECGAVVQVALDVVDVWEAFRISARLPDDPALILEAGTPLIKSAGVSSIKTLRSAKPDSVIVADTKTVDAADVEASLVSEAGGDAFTVLALASDETMALAVERASYLGLTVYSDTINVDDLDRAIRRSKRAGVHVALLHVGLDVQRRLGRRATDIISYIRRATELFEGPVAVAGGIKPREVGLIAGVGAKIIVIGSAIVKAEDPRSEAIKALESLKGAGFRCR
jgi:3-hexulose-6-phosphate synthase